MNTTPADLEAHSKRLWKAVVAGDEYEAVDAAADALRDGLAAETVLLEVIAPIQDRVGREWAADRMTVAQEHIATAVCERAVSLLARSPVARPPEPPARIAVACTDGEWHAMPARLLSTVLGLRGWQVDHVGTQLPIPYLIAHLHRTRPAVAALSSTMITQLPTAHSAVVACHAIGIPVLVGGAAYGPDGRYAQLVGAEGWAPDARGVADVLAAGPFPRPAPDHQPLDDLPHLADQEYTLVSRSAHDLVRQALTRLDGTTAITAQQFLDASECVTRLVEVLATALYLDEPEVLVDYMTWATDVLGSRQIPVHARGLRYTLDVLGDRLVDLPRTQGMLDQARKAMDDPS
ncbi:B12-binding domain-containing protein [Actinomadura barringtoniae]|uniref:B12-binding domain-containing protein n=1 Tax=Actinomadura barringtoniae TaxID=1427535 RepID=A0A939TGQ0_9ACTN|nr:B12-binding domain-containing protein [Actinomadura barringtoniae]MBO2455635.1 B12-binding domain-containing protein [Actinomadura barringtoniae]